MYSWRLPACVVPSPPYSPAVDPFRVTLPDVSPKKIDREGLGKSLRGTRQIPSLYYILKGLYGREECPSLGYSYHFVKFPQQIA